MQMTIPHLRELMKSMQRKKQSVQLPGKTTMRHASFPWTDSLQLIVAYPGLKPCLVILILYL